VSSARSGAPFRIGSLGRGVDCLRVRSTTRLYRGVKAHHAVSLSLAGCSEWRIDGREGTSEPGTMQLKEPGQVYRDLERHTPATFQLLCFDAELVDASRAALDVAPSARLTAPTIARCDPRGDALRRLHALALEGGDRFALEGAIIEAVAAYASFLDDPRGRADRDATRLRPAVRRARDFLLTHLADAVTLDAVAAHARADKFHLCRAFSAEVGLPPYAFLTHARIARARVLLRRGARPSELAPSLGFCDQSQMHRHFVRIVGVTPGEYAARA
jgi:AraC-like DNA-binding protein